MKKLSLILLFIAGISSAQLKIGYVDSDTIMKQYPDAQDAQKKLDALRKLTSPTARVIREGIATEIPAEQLVPGDIIELDSGDRIPADARILACSSCNVNEASLTGESIPSPKNNIPYLDPQTPISERSNMLYSGTFVQTGTAKALIMQTGVHTEIGKLSLFPTL